MVVETLRYSSRGIAGTYQNIDHHAKLLRPTVEKLEKVISKSGFKNWRQGHNVHVLITEDDRKFVFRPLCVSGEGYVGLNLLVRVSRSVEIVLCTIFFDNRNGTTPAVMAHALKMLAEVPPKHTRIADKKESA